MECLFCNIINNKEIALKVWENNDFLVILDIRPINPGHLLLMPKKHVGEVFEVSEPLFGDLFQVAKKIATPLKEAVSAARIGLAIEGFSVPHVHLHLVPVNNGNELNPERAKKVPEDELKAMQAHLLSFFKNIQ